MPQLNAGGLSLRLRADGRDWALATSTLRRDVFYYANIAVGQTVSSRLMSVDRAGGVVKTHTRLVREGDGRRLADVITAKALL